MHAAADSATVRHQAHVVSAR